MKQTILFAVALIVLASCTENEPVFSINPELVPYVDAFYSDASSASVDVPKNLIADIQTCQSIVVVDSSPGEAKLLIDHASFYNMKHKGQEDLIKVYVYTGLGRALLRKNINPIAEPEMRLKTVEELKEEIFSSVR
jgi:hypothetical protein